jgi:hypothetical protein
MQHAMPKPAQSATPASSRRERRTEFHTVVTLVAETMGEFHTHKAWLKDISVGGASLLCREPPEVGTVYLQVLMPKLAGRFIEADVVNCRVDGSLRIANRPAEWRLVGVRFVGYVADPELLQRLEAATATDRALSG